MKRLIFILLMLFLSCSISNVAILEDVFESSTTYRMKWNTLGGQGFLNTTQIDLRLQKFEQHLQEGNIIIYSIIVEYMAEDWIFIEDGESLVLLVDGERMGFEGEGSWKNREIVLSTFLREMAWYDITLQQLITIINAKEVRVKVVGSKYIVERYFSKDNFKSFRDFYNQYVKVNKSEK